MGAAAGDKNLGFTVDNVTYNKPSSGTNIKRLFTLNNELVQGGSLSSHMKVGRGTESCGWSGSRGNLALRNTETKIKNISKADSCPRLTQSEAFPDETIYFLS